MSGDSSSGDISRTLSGIRDLYAGSLARHGVGARSVGWRDEASHRLRFDRLVRIVDPERPFTAADWGCGYGALYAFLDERFGDRLTAYTGYDIAPEMIAAARAAVEAARVRFVQGSEVVEEADYVFVSGTFNVRLEASEADWDRYVKAQLETLFARARRGLAFNLLTSDVDWREPHLFYADPCAYFAFCRQRLSRRVALLHDYPLFEWTMLVLREES